MRFLQSEQRLVVPIEHSVVRPTVHILVDEIEHVAAVPLGTYDLDHAVGVDTDNFRTRNDFFELHATLQQRAVVIQISPRV